jgi:hypothetical protein
LPLGNPYAQRQSNQSYTAEVNYQNYSLSILQLLIFKYAHKYRE